MCCVRVKWLKWVLYCRRRRRRQRPRRRPYRRLPYRAEPHASSLPYFRFFFYHHHHQNRNDTHTIRMDQEDDITTAAAKKELFPFRASSVFFFINISWPRHCGFDTLHGMGRSRPMAVSLTLTSYVVRTECKQMVRKRGGRRAV